MDNKSKALEYLDIPRSTFYYHPLLDAKDAVLKDRILNVLETHQSYGHKRIALELKINKKRIKRVMSKFGIEPRRGHKKPWKHATKEGSEAAPNLLASLMPLYPHQVWVTDFTYIKWHGRWVYLCTVIDLFSREVLGISIKTNHSALLVSEALLNALAAHPAPALTHSDQGSEYRSKLFRSILKEYKIVQSMSQKGSPWQNGYQESFFSTWKVDVGDVNRFRTLGELTAEIYRSIYYYNNLRIHTSLGMAPKQFAHQNKITYYSIQEKLTV
jgi:transposase InsO family protein